MRRTLHVAFEGGGPLDGQMKTYEGNNPIGCVIVAPTKEKNIRPFLSWKYDLVAIDRNIVTARLRRDEREAYKIDERNMLCFKQELGELMKKYGVEVHTSMNSDYYDDVTWEIGYARSRVDENRDSGE